MRFLALYNGKTVSSAELLAVTADEQILDDFGKRLLGEHPGERPSHPRDDESIVRGAPPASLAKEATAESLKKVKSAKQ